jgi:hypothetical protein
MTNPLAVTNCNIDLENLIADPNRSIATLAITTLLKTGSEGSVDRLLKQIGTFMTDIADEFKIVVVEAIRALCLKFPQVRSAHILMSGGGGDWSFLARVPQGVFHPREVGVGSPPPPWGRVGGARMGKGRLTGVKGS